VLSGKTIILGVSSSIAAYKACEMVSRLTKLGAEVWVVMTEEATKLVGPLTFRTLSGNPVITSLFDQDISKLPVPHVALAQKAELFMIAPCTANIIGKLANGIADDPLTTLVLDSTAPKLIAPAMNCEMWRNPAVIENCAKLKRRGFIFVGPVEGHLACGEEDIGRMAEPEEIVQEALRMLGLRQDLKGKTVLVTAGGTKEAIDPVRFISNRSSGKMGFALAQAARERGADVILISSADRPAPLGLTPVKVETAEEMLAAVNKQAKQADIIIMAAAVADFRPVQNSKTKVKKVERRTSKVERRLELENTEDILLSISKRPDRKGKVLIGFALETDNAIANAKKKLKNKDLDLIVVNDPTAFDSETIKFSVIDRAGRVKDFSRQKKEQAARAILDEVIRISDDQRARFRDIRRSGKEVTRHPDLRIS
jgi:phosphopantothenoylcysteine decarboxylase/phosphopantothenate--cysteine ligase